MDEWLTGGERSVEVMTMIRTRVHAGLSRYSLAAVTSLLLVQPGDASETSFIGLGRLNGSPFISTVAHAVSDDGQIVAGDGGGLGFRWTLEGGMKDIGYLDSDGSMIGSDSWGISADGSTIVGVSSSQAGTQAIAHTLEAGMVGLGDLPGGDFYSIAFEASADGSTIVGRSVGAQGIEAFRWTAHDGMVGLGDLPGGDFYSTARGVSADGKTIVGTSDGAEGQQAYRWTAEEGMVGLGDLPGGDFYSTAMDVSADGTTIVGSSISERGREAFLWTAELGMVGLGDIPGDRFDSFAYAVSGDGRRVVGLGSGEPGNGAFMWDADNGIRPLRDVLIDAGADLMGWDVGRAWDISADGHAIVGTGTNAERHGEAFLATIPPLPRLVEIDIKPGRDPNVVHPFSRFLIPVALLGAADLDVREVEGPSLGFGPSAAHSAFDIANPWLFHLSHSDVNRDGYEDLLTFFRTQETGIALGATQACLVGEMRDGTAFEGCDSVQTELGCGEGFEFAVIVPPLVWLRRRKRRSGS